MFGSALLNFKTKNKWPPNTVFMFVDTPVSLWMLSKTNQSRSPSPDRSPTRVGGEDNYEWLLE